MSEYREQGRPEIERERPYVSAVIVAAGRSQRMGGENKLLLPLLGTPVIARTLIAFDAATMIDEIVVVTCEEDLVPIGDIIKYFTIQKVRLVVRGGETRQQSVHCGVEAVSRETEYLAIHDGARPLITPSVINGAVAVALEKGAAAAAVPVKDTLKRTDEEGRVLKTPRRDGLWSVQTPQVFKKDLYMSGMVAAAREGLNFTDDCQIVEWQGIPVYLCEGDYANIKITTREDLYIAEGLLRAKGAGYL